MARFRGVTKTEFVDQRQLNGHAFRLLEEAMQFILWHIPVAGRIEPGRLERQDVPLYPTLALVSSSRSQAVISISGQERYWCRFQEA